MISHEAWKLELNYPCFNYVLSDYSFYGILLCDLDCKVSRPPNLSDKLILKILLFSWITVRDVNANQACFVESGLQQHSLINLYGLWMLYQLISRIPCQLFSTEVWLGHIMTGVNLSTPTLVLMIFSTWVISSQVLQLGEFSHLQDFYCLCSCSVWNPWWYLYLYLGVTSSK